MQTGDTVEISDAWWEAFLRLHADLNSFVVTTNDKDLEDFLENALLARFCELPKGDEEERLFYRVFFADGTLRPLDEGYDDGDGGGWIGGSWSATDA